MKAAQSHDHTPAKLAERLAGCRKDWLPRVFPHGRMGPRFFELGDAEGAAGTSLPVPLDKNRRRFSDFAGGFERGDDLELLRRALRTDTAGACKEALELLGLGQDTGRKKTAPVTIARPLEEPPQVAGPVQTSRNEQAMEIWRQTDRIRRSRLAMDYLVCRRGITDWDDDRLRWHPACPWGSEHVGAIIAPITSHVTGMTIAIWRIRPSMTEPMGNRRMGLGRFGGGAARLIWAGDGDRLAIGEGVETSLALHQMNGWPVWAALSASNMAALVVPERFRNIVISQDNDGPAGPGPKAAQALARRLRDEGRQVRILGSDYGNDANDALLRRQAP